MKKRTPFITCFPQAGQNVVEFALATPLIVGLLVGLAYAGFLLHAQVTIANAARVGTTFLVRDPMATDAEVEEVVFRQLGVLDRQAVTVEVAPPREDRVPNVQVDVAVRYQASLLRITIPNLAGGEPVAVLGPLNLRAVSTLNVE